MGKGYTEGFRGLIGCAGGSRPISTTSIKLNGGKSDRQRIAPEAGASPSHPAMKIAKGNESLRVGLQKGDGHRQMTSVGVGRGK
jgi:hypothetical protein